MSNIFEEFLPHSGTEVNIIPVMPGDASSKVRPEDLPDVIPLLPLRNAVLFPDTVFPVSVGREKVSQVD